jgi:hypothetical protein
MILTLNSFRTAHIPPFWVDMYTFIRNYIRNMYNCTNNLLPQMVKKNAECIENRKILTN